MPASRMPRTLKRSPAKAQRTYEKTLESAEETYDGNEERAHRAAFASLKHSFEKVGDHWEPKKGGRKGPSDQRAKQRGPNSRGKTAGGVDVEGHTKDELLDRAKKLDIKGRSRMNKKELGQAIMKRERSRSRSSSRKRATGGRASRSRS
jgi:cation transport regulator ChaB